MSDNIPFDIQLEIIKKVYDVKSLIRFRSVSKSWKSFIDSSDFIKGYGARDTQPPSFLLRYMVDGECKYIADGECKYIADGECKYICLLDDDDETFKVQQQEFAPSVVVSPLLSQYSDSYVVGVSHGLLCLFYIENIVVIWNPSIGKSFGITLRRDFTVLKAVVIQLVIGFGVCPVTSDPTVVKISCDALEIKPWHVEVFTLSSGVWNVIPTGNLPRQSIRLSNSIPVVIDRFIYWAASEKTLTDDGVPHNKYMIVAFDLITKEFKVLNLPDSLTNDLIPNFDISVSKLKGSLVVYGHIMAEEAVHCGVWVMERDSSFRKLFTIGEHVLKILAFRKNGELVIEIRKEDEMFTTLGVYDLCSQQIKNLGISGEHGSFFMGSYKESLLLLDHSDLHIYFDDS